MTFKARLLLALVHTVARIQGGVLKLRRMIRRARGSEVKPEGPERLLILNDAGSVTEFMHVAFFPDRVIEQYGIVGQQAPRSTHSADLRENIQERADELMEDGYIRLQDFPGLSRVTVEAAPETLPTLRRELEDTLADRGLGLVTHSTGDLLEIDAVQTDLARDVIGAILRKDRYAGASMGE